MDIGRLNKIISGEEVVYTSEEAELAMIHLVRVELVKSKIRLFFLIMALSPLAIAIPWYANLFDPPIMLKAIAYGFSASIAVLLLAQTIQHVLLVDAIIGSD